MPEHKRRLVERVMEASFTEGLATQSLEDLRALRKDVAELENDLSFERRLCQARLDILSAELDHRAGRTEGDIISRLPQILADESSGTGSPLPRRSPDLSVPRATEVPRRRVEELVGAQTLARLTQMPEEEVRASLEALAEYERNLSSQRKRVHEVLDEIQGELVRRYTAGEADESALLE